MTLTIHEKQTNRILYTNRTNTGTIISLGLSGNNYRSDQQEVEWTLQQGTRTQLFPRPSPSWYKTAAETTTHQPTLFSRGTNNPWSNRRSYHRSQSLPIKLSRHPTQNRRPLPLLWVPTEFWFLGMWFLAWFRDGSGRLWVLWGGQIETDFLVVVDSCSGC